MLTQHNTTQHNTTQHNTTQHNTTQHNTTQTKQKFSFFKKTGYLFGMMLFSLLIISCNNHEENLEQSTNLQTELRSSSLGPGCGRNILDQCYPPNIQTLPFTLSNVAGYPGCTFDITITVSECGTQTFIGNFTLVTYNCPQYTIDLQNAINAGGITLSNFLSNFDTKLYNAFEIHYFNLNPLFCGTNFSSTFNWYLDACKQYCVRSINDGQGNPIMLKTVAASCGTGCCLRISEICKDPITGEIEKTTTYYPVEESNCGSVIPDFSRYDCKAISSCTLTCQ